MQTDRRVDRRIPVTETMNYTFSPSIDRGIKYTGIIKDVSRTGICFYTFQPIKKDTQITVEIPEAVSPVIGGSLVDDSAISDVSEALGGDPSVAVVKWCEMEDDSLYRIGVRLTMKYSRYKADPMTPVRKNRLRFN